MTANLEVINVTECQRRKSERAVEKGLDNEELAVYYYSLISKSLMIIGCEIARHVMLLKRHDPNVTSSSLFSLSPFPTS